MATIRLNWQNNGGTGKVQIHRKKDAGDYSQIGEVNFDQSFFDDTVLIDGEYTYKVVNANGGTFSIPSNPVTITTGVDGSGTQESGLSVSYDAELNRASLSWVTGTGTGNNIIQRKKDSGDFAYLNTVGASETSYPDDTITENGTYTYRVHNELIDGYSNEDDITVSGFGGSGDVGAKPDGLTITLYNEYTGYGEIGWNNHGAVGDNVLSFDGVEIFRDVSSSDSASFNNSFTDVHQFQILNTSVDDSTILYEFLVKRDSEF